MRTQTFKRFTDWGDTLRRGQSKIEKWRKEPSRRVDPAMHAPEPHHCRNVIPYNAANTAVHPGLPAFLSDIAGPTSRHIGEGSGGRRYSFLNLPPEIRNMIYNRCVDYPSCRDLFNSYYAQDEKRRKHNGSEMNRHQMLEPSMKFEPDIPLYTPTVLLLCKQITREALSILRTRVFVIDRIPPWVMGHPSPLPLTSFISVRTLQSVRFLEIRISLGEGSGSGRIWFRALAEFLQTVENHSLVKLKVMFKINNIHKLPVWLVEIYRYERIVKQVCLIWFSCLWRIYTALRSKLVSPLGA